MKITIDVELLESEAGYASQVVKLLQGVSDNVTAKVQTDKEGLARAIREAVASQKTDGLLQELGRRMARPELAQDCLEAICGIMFDAQRLVRDEPVMPYVQLLMRLPDPLRGKVKEEVVTQALNFLAQPRRCDAPRDVVLPYGEVFVAYMKCEAISVKGVVGMLIQLIRSENTRCAGLTCLCKVIESAADTVMERCDPALLELLRTTLGVAQDDAYLYDIEYITEPLGWNQNQASLKGVGNLTLQKSLRHHTQSILSLAFNPHREVVVTSATDGNIATWETNGNLIETCALARHYACSVDLGQRGHALVICGVGRVANVPPAIVFYAEDQNRWVEKGAIEPEGARLISVVKTMKSPSSLLFACGISGIHTGVSYYDATRVLPLREYHDHTDIVTALYAPQERDNVLVSGSRDSSIVLYDVRMPNATQSTQLYGTVSSITGLRDIIICGGLDKRLFVYDMRMMQHALAHRDMESAVLRVCVGSGSQGLCAVSTLTSLYVVNLNATSDQSSLLVNKADTSGAPSSRYHDLQWNATQNILFAGGDGSTMDVYGVTV